MLHQVEPTAMEYQTSPHFKTRRTLYPLFGNGYATVRSAPRTTGAATRINFPAPLGVSTGRIVKDATTPSRYWIELKRGTALGWVRDDVCTEKVPYSAPAPAKPATPATPPKPAASPSGDGQRCIANLVRNDQRTHAHLVKAQYHRERMARRPRIGVIDTEQDAQLAKLAARYNVRQQKVRSSSLLKVSTGVSQGTKALMDKLKAIISGPGVGALPLALVVPVALATVAGLSYLVYKAFFQDEADSAQDVLNAAKLSQTYQSMDAAEQELFDKTVQEAGNAGHKEGREDEQNGFFGQSKNLLLAAGFGVGLAYFINKSN